MGRWEAKAQCTRAPPPGLPPLRSERSPRQVVPHHLYLTMFSCSSVNVMPFDPLRGADHARAYASKYVAKPGLRLPVLPAVQG